MVVYHPYFHSFTRLFYQGIGYAGSDIVVGEYVVLEVDVLAGIFNVGEKSVEFGMSVGEYLNLVAGIID